MSSWQPPATYDDKNFQLKRKMTSKTKKGFLKHLIDRMNEASIQFDWGYFCRYY